MDQLNPSEVSSFDGTLFLKFYTFHFMQFSSFSSLLDNIVHQSLLCFVPLFEMSWSLTILYNFFISLRFNSISTFKAKQLR